MVRFLDVEKKRKNVPCYRPLHHSTISLNNAVETVTLTFVGDFISVVDHHDTSDVVSVVENGRLFLKHDFHAVHQLLFHRSGSTGATARSEPGQSSDFVRASL